MQNTLSDAADGSALSSSMILMACMAAEALSATNIAKQHQQSLPPSLEFALVGHLWPEDGAVSTEMGGFAQQGSAYGGYARDEPAPQWTCQR